MTRSPSFRARSATGLVAALLVSGCASAGGTPNGGIEHPTGNELVLRVEDRGGFVMANFHLVRLPAFTLVGDGRVIVPGAQIDIFPGPALPALQVRRLTEEGLQAVLEAVAASGQFAEDRQWQGMQNFVADAPDTHFILNAEGRTVTVQVYALGMTDFGGPGQGLTAEEAAAHAALAQLRDRLMLPDEWLGEGTWADPAWREYTAEALRLVVRNADADEPGDEGLEPQELPWPVGADPAAFGDPTQLDGTRCGVVSGEDAATWYDVLAGANQLTRFTSGGHRYEVQVRPLMPDEPATCPDLG